MILGGVYFLWTAHDLSDGNYSEEKALGAIIAKSAIICALVYYCRHDTFKIENNIVNGNNVIDYLDKEICRFR
jgi:hypothetical protein